MLFTLFPVNRAIVERFLPLPLIRTPLLNEWPFLSLVTHFLTHPPSSLISLPGLLGMKEGRKDW